VERGTFPHIEPAFEDFVVARLYTKGHTNSETFVALQMRLLGEASMPRYVVLDPETETVLKDWAYKFEFTRDPKTFSKLLKAGLRAYKRRNGN